MSYFSKKWEGIKPLLIMYFRSEGVKLIMKKVLGTAVMGGIKGWIVKFTLQHLIDDVAIPVFKAGEAEVLFYLDKKKGRKLRMKLKKSRRENDELTYDSTIDDIFN